MAFEIKYKKKKTPKNGANDAKDLLGDAAKKANANNDGYSSGEEFSKSQLADESSRSDRALGKKVTRRIAKPASEPSKVPMVFVPALMEQEYKFMGKAPEPDDQDNMPSTSKPRWWEQNQPPKPAIKWSELMARQQNFDDFDPDNLGDIQEENDGQIDQEIIDMDWSQFGDDLDFQEQVALGLSFADCVKQNPTTSNFTPSAPRKSIEGSPMAPLEPDNPFHGWNLQLRVKSTYHGNFENPKGEWCFMNAPMQFILDILSENDAYRNSLYKAVGERSDPILAELLALCAQRTVKQQIQSCKNLRKAINSDGRFEASSKYHREKLELNYHDACEFIDTLYEKEPLMMSEIFGRMLTADKPLIGIINMSGLINESRIYDIFDKSEENESSNYCILRLVEHEHIGKSKGQIHLDQRIYEIPTKAGLFRIYALILFNEKKGHYIALVQGREGWIAYDDLKDTAYKIGYAPTILNENVHIIVFERMCKRGW
jgi:hypothetical protein